MRKCLLIIAFISCFSMVSAQNPYKLWYRQAAEKWVEALPVGNGRMGAMVFGDAHTERIQINEESVWAGSKYNSNNPNALGVLDTVRQLLFANKNAEASAIAQANMVSVRAEGSDELARTFRSYQPLMDLNIVYHNRHKPENYRRELDIFTGVATSTFTKQGIVYTQKVFASAPDDILVLHIKSSVPKKLNLSFYLNRPDDKNPLDSLRGCTVQVLDKHNLLLKGQIIDIKDEYGPGGKHMKFAGLAHVGQTDGNLSVQGDKITLTSATELVIYISGATNYHLEKLDFVESEDPVEACRDYIAKLSGSSYQEVLQRHKLDHSAMMKRMDFDLFPEKAVQQIPTDLRLAQVKSGQYDAYLTELYFQYGRYLLMGSSRAPGKLPANLQGIWNEHMVAPWKSDFHTNINLQMNYWPAELCNLSETTLPLFNFMQQWVKPGRVTAKEMYGADGWVMHHATDVFGKTSLQSSVWWGTFPMATGWMALHMWEHYLFTQNASFLKETAYPLMKEHALFLADYLIESPEGYLVTSPAYSPENRFIHPKTGKEEYLTYGPTMDNQIIREFLTACIKAADVLASDSSKVIQWKDIIKKLPPTRLGDDGRILEWIKDYEEAEPGHRHISHLFGLHPGTQITATSPELFEGARKTIEYRLAHGGGHTGWSKAWIINLYARLLDGDKALEHLHSLFAKSTLNNLFDTHPPFQIDGNFGATAAIAEMLVQSHKQEVHFLPALPKAWKNGRISGLRVRGGAEVAIYWENGFLTKVEMKALVSNNFVLHYGDVKKNIHLDKGEKITLNKQLIKI